MSKIKLSDVDGNEVEISQITVIFTQTPDSMSPDGVMQELAIFTENAGEDNYFVIATTRWAFDNIDEFIMLLNEFKKRL